MKYNLLPDLMEPAKLTISNDNILSLEYYVEDREGLYKRNYTNNIFDEIMSLVDFDFSFMSRYRKILVKYYNRTKERKEIFPFRQFFVNAKKAVMEIEKFSQQSVLLKGLEESTATKSGEKHLLMIDIGGSTTDIVHVIIAPDGKGSYEYRTMTRWPQANELKCLGQIDIDKAVFEYMVNKGYIIDYVAQERINWCGYQDFRDFKETWSDFARKDDEVRDLGRLKAFDNCCVDRRNIVFSPVDYEESKKLNRNDFLELVNPYLESIQSAIRSILAHDNVKESDIDYVILSGGGTKMYGIKEMITGELTSISKPLTFSKIMADKSRCIECEQNPSAICCMGNLIETKKVNFKASINGSFYVEFDLFQADASRLANNSLIRQTKDNGRISLPDDSNVFYKGKFYLNKDMDALPIIGSIQEQNFSVQRVAGNKICCRVAVLKADHNGSTSHVEKSWISFTDRSLITTFKDRWNGGSETSNGKVKFMYSISENEFVTMNVAFYISGATNGANAFRSIVIDNENS